MVSYLILRGTNQTGKGVDVFIGQPTVDRVSIWFSTGGVKSGSAFRRIRRGENVTDSRITTRALRSIIKSRIQATDAPDSNRYSAHSLRVGSAQSLAAAGASLVGMQIAGRWQSPVMPARYASKALAARGAIAKYRYGAAA